MTSRWWNEQSRMAQKVAGGIVYKAKSNGDEVDGSIVRKVIRGVVERDLTVILAMMSQWRQRRRRCDCGGDDDVILAIEGYEQRE